MRKRPGKKSGTPRIARRMENLLELPTGVLSGSSRMEVTDDRKVVIEGCRGILEYEEDVIRLHISCGVVRFCGQKLCLSGLTEDSALVTGRLLSIEFLHTPEEEATACF